MSPSSAFAPRPRHEHRPPERSHRDRPASRCPTASVTTDCLPMSSHRQRSPTLASRHRHPGHSPRDRRASRLPPPPASPRAACRRLPIANVRPRSPTLASRHRHPGRSPRDRRASRCPHRRRHHGLLANVSPSPAFTHARVTGNNLLRAALAIATRHVAPATASPGIARRRLPVVSLGPRSRQSRRASRVTNRDRHAPHGHSAEVTTYVSPHRAGNAAASTALSCCPIIAIAARHAAPQCQANMGSLSTSDLYRTQ